MPLHHRIFPAQLTETTTGKLQWVKLGHATHAEIKALVDGGIKATDIMDSTLTDPSDTSYTKIVLNKKTAWVRVKAGQEKAAAFLETHRCAALKGGSMAFTKNEGTTVNAKDKIAYSAYANIQDSMVEGGSGYVAGLRCTIQEAGGWRRGVAQACGSTGGRYRRGHRQRMDAGRTSVLITGEDIRPTAWATPPIRTRSPTPTT